MSPIPSLNELAARYLRKKGYRTELNITLEGASGSHNKFDFIVSKTNEHCVVQILEWKRTVGVNAVISLDKASADVGFEKPILIAEKFSSHARAYANRKGITLLTKRDLKKL